jgi:hypothetical protein
MTIQEIHRLREERPFRPFRVLTAGRRSYDVVHPECLGQSPSGRLIMIGLPDDSTLTLDLLLVSGIQKGIKSPRNGAGKKK